MALGWATTQRIDAGMSGPFEPERGVRGTTPRPAAALAAALTLACAVSPLGAQPAPGAEPPAVAPVERWARFERVPWRGDEIEVRLRTGYARPLILPEPVSLEEREPLPGARMEIDADVVLFEPVAHFGPVTVVLVGETTGTRYALRVGSSPYGDRIPLEIVRP